MRYKYLLFDNDGVLVDTEYWYFEATRRALAELGVPLDPATYQELMVRGVPAWELAQARGLSPASVEKQRAQRNQWYRQYLAREDIEIAGVRDTLQRLAPAHRMAVVTTAKAGDFDAIHRDRALLEHMEFVLTREDYRQSKPHPEPYRKALERFGADRREALVVEDSERGLRAALAAGIDCAVVYNRFTESHDFSGATYLLDAIAQLPDLLRR